MKRIFAMILCGLLLCGTASCKLKDTGLENESLHESTALEIEESTAPSDDENGEKIIIASTEHYLVSYAGFTYDYEIYDKDGNTVRAEQTTRPLSIDMLDEDTVDIQIGYGTGIQCHTYYSVSKNLFSEEYSYVVAASGSLVAYIDGSMQDRKLIVRHIFEKEEFYKEFALDFSDKTDTPIKSATFFSDEKTLQTTYLARDQQTEVTVILPIRFSGEETSQHRFLYWSNGDGTCAVSALGDQMTVADIPSLSPRGDLVTEVLPMAFSDCKSLSQVRLPDTIKEIGGSAFAGCDRLKSVTFGGSESQWKAINGVSDMELSVEVCFEKRADFTSYDSIINLYREIVAFCTTYDDYKKYDVLFDFANDTERDWFHRVFSSTYLLYSGRGTEDHHSPHYQLSCGYARKDLNGDGTDELILLRDDYVILAIFSMSDGKPVLLDNFWERKSCWIDENGVLYVNGSGGTDVSTMAIYQINDHGQPVLIAEFGRDGHEWVGDTAVELYYKIENGEKVRISKEEFALLYDQYDPRTGQEKGTEVTEKRAGLTFVPLFELSKKEMVVELFSAVLKNETRVVEYHNDAEGEYKYLKDCKMPYSMERLEDIKEHLQYALVDMDGDGIDELVVSGGDTLILRYYEGKIYCYSYIFRNMYDIKQDGSFSWNHNGIDFEYGENKLRFEGVQPKGEVLWRIVNDGEPNAEYYIAGQQVTETEIQEYFKNNPKTNIEYSRLDPSTFATNSEGKG
ncbi:MAG: leucine-rich repeat protein [Clostridia bacterium]|nr:leucine-rich repeat protein [Clostridia bacterium]